LAEVEMTSDPNVPDSIFTWIFVAVSGDRWGGTLVADSAAYAPGDTIPAAAGSYAIQQETEFGTDLSAGGLEDGHVFVEWYWDAGSARFLPTRNGLGSAGSTAGLGFEQDAAWTGTGWAAFGLGGQRQADAAVPLADTVFTWVFHANSGDLWSGILFGPGAAYDPGSTVQTAHGVYRITGEAAQPPGAAVATGTVRLTGGYFDSQSRREFAPQGVDGSTDHGLAGLGSELGQIWNDSAWSFFGQGGALQVNVPRGAANFDPMRLALGSFGAEAGGWASQERFPRTLADVTGDGRADIVGFGNAGVWVAPANAAGGFDPMRLALGSFGAEAGGWASQERFPRTLADVTGDGRADIIGFGNAGVWVAPANAAGGFDPMRLVLGSFGAEAGGWASQERFPRTLADVTGDGRADIIGFGNAGVWVAPANAAGGFDPMRLVLGSFGAEAGGWASQERFPRTLADVTGDGRADIVGFGNAGVWVAPANAAGGFDPMRLVLGSFGAEAGGWASQERFPRTLADVTGDGRADIIGFGNAGVWVAPANAAGGFDPMRLVLGSFGAEAGGWASQERFPRTLADVTGDGRADIIGFGDAGVWVASAFPQDGLI
jgi:hypothetical protein